ncbi:hypothetical protein SUGI_0037780 [Cryptomeria japonica]|uniref:probable glucan 1,3-beta-glucosidase A n=1 Tax=Cryptomeria japonica TaxID=3369 RepID=UPI002408ACF9|nr:probable glucan 1,3-beta-glucosidase A [Cryptomeria japonica]GLJ06384.1 hypothetical protein SUGI_0037780 [Cryptomeria japonica]
MVTYKSVNLGGWLVVEGWIKPSLFDSVPDKDLMDGTQIQLKSVALGTYLVAEGGGGEKIAVNRNSPSGWETFRLWRVKEGSYHLRVFNKQFIAAQNGGGGIVNAVATTPSTWETFQIIRNNSNPNRVHIKALNGMYIQAKSQDQLTADFQGDPGWGNNAATFEMTIVKGLQGEYQLTNGLGPDRAPQVLNDHRNSYIQESDFTFLSQKGINCVRIPVGWWIASDPNPPAPFVGGSLQALDNAFSWAKNHNIKIIVTLHAAPGSQNGDEHSGARDGYIEWDSEDNMNKSLSVIDFLASRYANDSALLGIELLNEPRAPDIAVDKLRTYYRNGYNTIRKYSSTAYVVMCNRIGPADPKELFEMNNGLAHTVVDVHYYNLFDDQRFKGMTVQQNIDHVYGDRGSTLSSLVNANGPLIYVGEWTSEWEVQGASMSDYQRFGQAQLQVYGKASFGWAYWTHKNVNGHWSFEWMVKNNYLQL